MTPRPRRRARRRPLPVLLTLALLVLTGCAALAPARAELVLDVVGPDGAPASGDALDAAALVVARRLADADIPPLDVTRREDHLLVRFGDAVSDADLDEAERIAAFSSSAEFRPVLVSAAPESSSPSVTPEESDPEGSSPSAAPTDASDPNWITAELLAEFESTDCATLEGGIGDPGRPLIACQDDGSVKYLLGPVEITGSSILAASPSEQTGAGGTSTDSWSVTLEFDAAGTSALADQTARLVALPSPRNQFAVVLDGAVMVAPAVNAAITDGRPQISGGFDEEDARVLAGRFRLGALGIQTRVSSLTILDD